MVGLDVARHREQGWAPQARRGIPTPALGFGSLFPEAPAQGQASANLVTISDWPARSPDLQYVENLSRSMFRAVVVCTLSAACAALAVVALILFAQSGWDAVHPWVSLMIVVGSLGLLGIGLGILVSAKAQVEKHLHQRRIAAR